MVENVPQTKSGIIININVSAKIPSSAWKNIYLES